MSHLYKTRRLPLHCKCMASLTQTLAFSQMSDEELARVLKENKIGLTLAEAREVEKILGRAPTLTEAIVWGIQGSEHCSYRSSRPFLKTLPTKAPNVMLGVGEDAGIVHFARANGKDGQPGKSYGVIMGHESHNHPSQVVPFEGAATGIGGLVRDIIVMGGRAIATADPLRFGALEKPAAKSIAQGVISGIAGYGNPLGVPNLAGDTYFDDSFNDNCLVNVAVLGSIREDEIIHSFVKPYAEGWDIIIVGKPTDNSGMGGAAFASLQLNEADKEANKGAVQEPNPFLERHMAESTYALFAKLRDQGHLDKVSFKDMGAGGNICATVEQVEPAGFGATVDLAKVHVSMPDLAPAVIACAETQERLCWMCDPQITNLILDHYNKEWDLPNVSVGARASLVGKVTKGNYVATFGDQILIDAPASDVTKGVQYQRAYSAPTTPPPEEPTFDQPDLAATFLKLLASENIASRLPIFENYDKVVQGQTVFEPGIADAGLLVPFRNRAEAPELHKVGAALSVDANPRYGKISPYWCAVNAVVEGMRNVAAIGATPWAVTDCLNFGNPEKPEQMWELVESIRGMKDTLEGVGHLAFPGSPLPVVSGNVSLYNESPNGSVAPSPVMGTLGRIENVDKAISMELKEAGSALYLIGERKDECGGSEYYRQLRLSGLIQTDGAQLPQPDFKQVRAELALMVAAVDQGLLLSSHDISDGGLAVALAEMAAGGRGEGLLSVTVDLTATSPSTATLRADKKLFSETGGFVVEVSAGQEPAFESLARQNNVTPILLGRVTDSSDFLLTENNQTLLTLPASEVKKTWLNGLRNRLA